MRFIAVFAALLVIGCNSPTIPGTPAYQERVAALENEVQARIKTGNMMFVVRSTARAFTVTYAYQGNTQKLSYYGPVTVLEIQPGSEPRRGDYLAVVAEFQTRDEAHEHHTHIIEWWWKGTLLTTRRAEGVGERFVTLFT